MKSRDVFQRINERLAQQAADQHNEYINDLVANIEADEAGKLQPRNSIGSWVDKDPWTVEDYVLRYRAKKLLRSQGKPTDPLWVRWMLDVMDVRAKNAFRKHNGKPLRKIPPPPSKKS